MKRILLCFALALSPLTLAGVTACANFEQVAPKTPRQAIADAEASVIGTAQIAGSLYNRGVIDRDTAASVLSKLVELARTIETAKTLLRAGETVASSKSIAEVAATLSALALQMSIARDTAAPPAPEPQPAPAAFRPTEI